MTPERWERVQELYHAYRERSEYERTAFLAEACGPDEALRCEVQALLVRSESDVARLPGARKVSAPIVPGPSAVYAFYRTTTQRNLYRIPLR